ncbi:CLUMA_CG007004, isoform A [Clunio marinus]|uniref:Trifunctional purine biosynthetic protein adenosine-3 n=1 Tax=Clunio marinus TaxID=568069 RepID=A0A1J1I1K5_9DIPT|nr:CLUMA_CG007004, isoform A [Clunio marinus]
MKNILVIGSGGREHAICWKLQQSKNVSTVYALPGSHAIAQLEKAKIAEDLNLKDFQSIAAWCLKNKIELVVVGPEDSLANGITDVLNEAGIKCFGPSKKGAQIEANKDWSKAFMERHEIPTAQYKSFTNPDEAKNFIKTAPFQALVVKASGLAAGKGVIVAKNVEEACTAAEILGSHKFGNAGDVVVIEELLSGEEVSVLAFVDSENVRMLLPAQDHKRLKDNDEGLNTGGMGAYCPCPLISKAELEFVQSQVLQKAVDGLRKEGIKYNGILYAGMMLTPNGPKTLEFNCRFGDPETQVILPLLEHDLFNVMIATATNQLNTIDELKFKENCSAVGVVMASKGYPETSTKGCIIKGIETISSNQLYLIFHSGTLKNSDNEWTTNGGRVLINVALAQDLIVAANLATSACDVVVFDGSQFRRDIAKKAFKCSSTISYKDSGVDIEAGESLVQRIKPLARGTNRSGVIGEVGSFGGLFRLKDVTFVNREGEEVNYKDPVLVQGTDGVGTKLKIAEAMNIWDTIGIDLVAMCVNDVLCNGAEPLAFLDYIACGRLDVPTAALIVKGISIACRESNCALLGGETAEMPSMYRPGTYDLAGYCVGVVENDLILPKMNDIHVGDIVIALPSSGLHSNGFSLVNKIFESTGFKLSDPAPFSESGKTFGREFLTPTKLYMSDVLPLLRRENVKALAHITGGGLVENIPRILPPELGVQIDAITWKIPPVFGWLAAKGNVEDQEMLKTFNCGIGMILILPRGEIDWESISDAKLIGNVVNRDGDLPQVIVKNFTNCLSKISEPWKDGKSVKIISYKQSGVDIQAGNSLVQNIKPHAKSTNRDGVLGSIGSFGGLFRLRDLKKVYNDPVLVLGTDGVGTKLKIAQQLEKHETVGIDLVAMCVNDILCNGAEPMTFLDYFACGKLKVDVATNVVCGIAEGCRQSKCALLGGETAEMPGMYDPNVYDLAGFALGLTEFNKILPKRDSINVGDVIIGLPSSGIHSNGLSLVRKVLETIYRKLEDIAPFSASEKNFGEELLVPTKIYIQQILPALETGFVKALAHITGGGLWENIPRVLPHHLTAELNGKVINIQPIFGWLTSVGKVDKLELMKTFNCGVGMVLIASAENEMALLKSLHGSGASVIGKIIPTKPGGHQLIIRHFATCVERIERLLTTSKKRVGVLISGSGSNLQALIDATRETSMGMCSEIVHVISNRSEVYGLERAKKANIPTSVISNKNYSTRNEFDEALHAELVRQNVEIVCLAGFMRILTPEFVQKWKGRLINIHPSLLPKFKGIHAQKEALESGDDVSGCTVHFVDENVDTGAIIVQEIVPILKDDSIESLSARILKSEHIAFPKALRLVANGYVKLSGKGETEWI